MVSLRPLPRWQAARWLTCGGDGGYSRHRRSVAVQCGEASHSARAPAALRGASQAVNAIPKGAECVVIIDCVGLDPALMPAVGMPAPGGMTISTCSICRTCGEKGADRGFLSQGVRAEQGSTRPCRADRRTNRTDRHRAYSRRGLSMIAPMTPLSIGRPPSSGRLDEAGKSVKLGAAR
jgi:hypothetical protein